MNIDRQLVAIVFGDAVPATEDMDYKDHAAAWSSLLWDVLCRDNLHVGPVADRARELGLLRGHSCPRQFLQALEYLRAVRSNERNGFSPVKGEA